MAVTVYAQRRVIGTNRYDYDLKGLSTDEKPSKIYGIEIVENSLFLEMDTGDFYYLKSQGSSTTTRETLIEEQSFTGGFIAEVGAYLFEFDGEHKIDANSIYIVFDGVIYSCEMLEDSDPPYLCKYGAQRDSETGVIDFSEYPFHLCSEDDDGWFAYIFVADGNEHTIEVYTESTVTTPTVWEKVGGGSSSANNLVGSAVVGTAQAG